MDVYDALYKKAIGYTAEEEIREYGKEDELIKRKVTYKCIPPDTQAAKAYMEFRKESREYSKLSDEELLLEAGKLYEMIKEMIANGDCKD